MQQTILAVLALMIATLLSFNQDQALLRAQEAAIDSDMEVMASGVALQVMEYIGRKAFDESTVDGERIDATFDLSNSGAFGASGQCDVAAPIQKSYPYAVCDDLDDFHEMPPEEVPFLLRSDTLHFSVTATVVYVEDDGSEAAGKTFNKKVTVYVQDAGSRTFLRVPIELSRVFSYEKMKFTN